MQRRLARLDQVATWRNMLTIQTRWVATVVNGASTWVLAPATLGGGVATAAGVAMFPFTPEDFEPSDGGELELRLRMAYMVNDVALGRDAVFGLYPIATALGASGVVGGTVGAVIAASQFTIASATLAANAMGQVVGPAFTAPAAGLYAIGFTTAGAWTANSGVSWGAALQGRLAT